MYNGFCHCILRRYLNEKCLFGCCQGVLHTSGPMCIVAALSAACFLHKAPSHRALKRENCSPRKHLVPQPEAKHLLKKEINQEKPFV